MVGNPAKLDCLKSAGDKKQPKLNFDDHRMDRIKELQSYESTESTTTKRKMKAKKQFEHRKLYR